MIIPYRRVGRSTYHSDCPSGGPSPPRRSKISMLPFCMSAMLHGTSDLNRNSRCTILTLDWGFPSFPVNLSILQSPSRYTSDLQANNVSDPPMKLLFRREQCDPPVCYPSLSRLHRPRLYQSPNIQRKSYPETSHPQHIPHIPKKISPFAHPQHSIPQPPFRNKRRNPPPTRLLIIPRSRRSR